jgi:hypothetical protein
VAGSAGLQQAAPANDPAFGSSIGYIQIESHKDEAAGLKHRQGPFPGAACCHLIELPSYKAAPLPAVGHATSFGGPRPTPLLELELNP